MTPKCSLFRNRGCSRIPLFNLDGKVALQRYTGRRPRESDSGDHVEGAIPWTAMKSVVVRLMACGETEYRSARSSNSGKWMLAVSEDTSAR